MTSLQSANSYKRHLVAAQLHFLPPLHPPHLVCICVCVSLSLCLPFETRSLCGFSRTEPPLAHWRPGCPTLSQCRLSFVVDTYGAFYFYFLFFPFEKLVSRQLQAFLRDFVECIGNVPNVLSLSAGMS